MNGSTLELAHSGASLLLLLASLFMIYEIALYVRKNPSCRLRKKWQSLKAVATRILGRGDSTSTTKHQGKASQAPIVFALLVGCALVYGASRINDAPVAEEHNVAVLASLGDNEWRMRSDEEGEFVYRACPDFDNASVIWVGYIADRAKWKEYGKCKSIRDTGLGFYWRDGHNEWRTIDAGTAR